MTTFAQQEVASLRDRIITLNERIQAAMRYASDSIGGGDEDRHFDSVLSSIIGILEGELNADGVPR